MKKKKKIEKKGQKDKKTKQTCAYHFHFLTSKILRTGVSEAGGRVPSQSSGMELLLLAFISEHFHSEPRNDAEGNDTRSLRDKRSFQKCIE